MGDSIVVILFLGNVDLLSLYLLYLVLYSTGYLDGITTYNQASFRIQGPSIRYSV